MIGNLQTKLKWLMQGTWKHFKDKHHRPLRIYIAGAIHGHPDAETRFTLAEKELRQQGYIVFNPYKESKLLTQLMKKRFIVTEKSKWRYYLRNDITNLMWCDEIYMLNGWDKSNGATLELQLAMELGIKVKYEDDYIKTGIKVYTNGAADGIASDGTEKSR